ncbi:MAG: VWA domain-containing protein [Candidatus Coatesbacteria bacterium]|nr:MAG: VWA domain-containing protein [Candidatus Coatesbacteria bacterium]
MFTFLQPLFLFLLPLTGLPIVINLLRRRVKLRVRWPSLILLKRVEERRARRRLRFVEILLIVLRMLIIAFTILTLSRPYVHSPGGSPPRDVVVIVDNSVSMAYPDGGRERYSAALDAAKNYLNSLGETDRAVILFATGGWSDELLAPADAAEALTTPPGLEPLRSYVAAVTEAAELLEESGRIREINVFCDMQASHFDGLQTFPSGGFRVYVRDIRGGPGPYGNLALADVSVRPDGNRFAVKTVVKGYGDFSPASLRVSAAGTETKYPVGGGTLSLTYSSAPGGAVELALADEPGYRFDDAFVLNLPPTPETYYYVEPTCPGAAYFRTAFDVLGSRGLGAGETPPGPTVFVTTNPSDTLESTTALNLIVPTGAVGSVGPPDWGLEITGTTRYDGKASAGEPLFDTAAAGPIRVHTYYSVTYEREWEPVASLPDGNAIIIRRAFSDVETYVLLLPVEGENAVFPRQASFVTFAGDLLGRSLELTYPDFRRFTDLSLEESNVETIDGDTLNDFFPGAEIAEPTKARGGWSFSLIFPFAAAVLLLLAAEALLAAYVTRTTA